VRAVNLLPKVEQKKSFEAGRGVGFAAAGGVALVTVALSASMLGASGKISEHKLQIDALNAQLAAIPKPDKKKEDATGALVTQKNERLLALSAALGGRVAWDGVLRQIAQVLPTDVWLTSLATAAVDPAVAAATPGVAQGPTLTIVGSTYSQTGVARLLSRLTVVPSLTNVQLVSSTMTEGDEREVVQFTISAQVKTTRAAS
jgi:Tfp pilus assembly protein PilN